MGVIYEIPNTKAKILLGIPASPTRAAILFIPGISGGAMTERFQPLVDAALQNNFAIARFSSWEGENAVDSKTPSEIFAEIDGAIEILRAEGFEKIAGVGKSFGGGMLLADVHADLFAKVLWAPAIGYAEPGNIEQNLLTTFKTLDDLLALTVGREYLARFTHPVCFIHGTADTTIPFTNSTSLSSLVAGSTLVPIEGADHSYKNKEHEKQVIEHSISFILSSLG